MEMVLEMELNSSSIYRARALLKKKEQSRGKSLKEDWNCWIESLSKPVMDVMNPSGSSA